jgi:hypothetical protein
MQPIPGPWLSPNEVTVNSRPMLLPDIALSLAYFLVIAADSSTDRQRCRRLHSVTIHQTQRHLPVAGRATR